MYVFSLYRYIIPWLIIQQTLWIKENAPGLNLWGGMYGVVREISPKHEAVGCRLFHLPSIPPPATVATTFAATFILRNAVVRTNTFILDEEIHIPDGSYLLHLPKCPVFIQLPHLKINPAKTSLYAIRAKLNPSEQGPIFIHIDTTYNK